MNNDSNIDKKQFVSSKKVKSLLDVSYTTLHRWSETNKIRSIKTPSGQRRYNIDDIQTIINFSSPIIEKRKICYCRVSSSKQMDDLNRQKDFFKQRFPHHELVTDVGSGINWKRKGLRTILEQSMLGNVEEIVVAHRDRLCRFAFELLEYIFQKHKVKLLVLNELNQESSNNELADDILSIITIYSCRAMGKRRYCSKKNKDLSQSTSKENIQRMV